MKDESKSAERLEKILAVLLLQSMKGAPMREKTVQLSIAGFSNVEIADLLQTSAQSIAQVLYEARRKKKGTK